MIFRSGTQFYLAQLSSALQLVVLVGCVELASAPSERAVAMLDLTMLNVTIQICICSLLPGSPIIKSSTAVLLEAAASLEESSPFLAPKKKKKRDREDKEKSKTEEKKKSNKKDKEGRGSHSEVHFWTTYSKQFLDKFKIIRAIPNTMHHQVFALDQPFFKLN